MCSPNIYGKKAIEEKKRKEEGNKKNYVGAFVCVCMFVCVSISKCYYDFVASQIAVHCVFHEMKTVGDYV